MVPFLQAQPKPMTVGMLRAGILNLLWKSVPRERDDPERAWAIERERALTCGPRVIGPEPNATLRCRFCL
ncbi:MAG TPA: hypothetical protein PLI31_07150 [Methanoregulaceae archaeon]|nr:hypothetical protein [Methanoregulaceae archaeon]